MNKIEELRAFHLRGAEACEAFAVTPDADMAKNKDLAKHYRKTAGWHREAVEAIDSVLAREAALREELALIIKSFDELAACVGFSEARLDQTGDSPVDCANQLQQRLTAAERRAVKFEGLLREVMECPQVVESATIPRMGIESAPHNVVVTIHIALLRLRKVQAALRPVEGE